jgi:methionyl-tRNA formyltransferase
MSKLRIIYLGGKQAGVVGLLTAIALDCDIKAVVTGSLMVKGICQRFNLPVYHSVKQPEILNLIPEIDLMISVHSREIIPNEILKLVRLGGINIHPCLATYKGKAPIQRFIDDNATKASVGVHYMTEQVDMGETLKEMFVDIDRTDVNTVDGVYNILYPYYSLVLIDVLKELSK